VSVSGVNLVLNLGVVDPGKKVWDFSKEISKSLISFRQFLKKLDFFKQFCKKISIFQAEVGYLQLLLCRLLAYISLQTSLSNILPVHD